MCLREFGVRAVITALFLQLSLGSSAVAFAADEKIAVDTYTPREFTAAKLPAISSCDAKATSDSITSADMPATGSSYMDAILGTAAKLDKSFGNKSSTDTEDSDDEDDVDGNATLETDCEALKEKGASDKLGIDSEKLQCGVVNADGYIEHMKEMANASRKYLACKRGVLDALRGEIGCFKKQIADAEGYMNELVNGQGGLAEMLKAGNDDLQKIDQEVQDRTAQMTAANERIEGGEGGNPPGLRQAKDKITELSQKLPTRVTQVKQQTENLRNQQSRFETMVGQLSMARAMECMNAPTAGYRCVAEGTMSSNHPEWNGAVSPMTYLKCLTAQSANKLVNGKVIKNAKREEALLKTVDAAFTQASAKAPNPTSLPDFSDAKAFAASMKVYTVKTPADLEKLLAPTLQTMEGATGKAMTAQFRADMNRCYSTAKKEIAAERVDSNSPIKASETAMKQSFETTRSANATAFREMRDTYLLAVKAATGQSVNIDTSKCEAASLEDQGTCFDALNSMTDALLTGKVNPTQLTGPAMALTNGQEPIHGFSSTLAAKNVSARSITVNCSGVDDCLTKYTNYRTQLKAAVDERKAFKETYKGNINNKLLNTAKELASKGTMGAGAAGVQASTITLNAVAANIERRKTQLATALSRLGVKDGLDLDAKEIKTPEKDENGLFKPSDLRTLVMSEIVPALPDTSGKGFTKTTDAISERDEALDKLQDAIEKDFNSLEAKKAECTTKLKEKNCQVIKDFQKEFCESDKDSIATSIKSWEDIKNRWTSEADVETDATKKTAAETKAMNAQKEIDKLKASKLGEKTAPDPSSTTELTCGTAPAAYADACGFAGKISTVGDKGNQSTGKSKSDSDDANTGN